MLEIHNDKARLELSTKGKSTKLNGVLKLYLTINYTEDDDKKKTEEDIVFHFKSFIESLYYFEDIVELDLIENFDNEKNTVFTKKKLLIEDFISFCTGSRYITHNLMRVGTINFQYFEQDSSPGVRVVVNTCKITLTFPVNGLYNSKPEQFLKNIDNIKLFQLFWKVLVSLQNLIKLMEV